VRKEPASSSPRQQLEISSQSPISKVGNHIKLETIYPGQCPFKRKTLYFKKGKWFSQ
jgi:hypothetical protein